MEIETMGKVLVSVKVENVVDLYLASRGTIPPEEIRRVEVSDAVVDTGATSLSMPTRMIGQLGLEPLRTRQARTTAGIVTFNVFGTVRLTIQGRDCTLDVTEVPDNCPVLIGVVPLELLDFIVDPKRRQLVGNPEHGGEDMLDMFPTPPRPANSKASHLPCLGDGRGPTLQCEVGRRSERPGPRCRDDRP